MQLKYALLHCSYSAPVTVDVIASDTSSIAARDITDDAPARAPVVVECVPFRVVAVVAERETVFAPPRGVDCDWVVDVRDVRTDALSPRFTTDGVVLLVVRADTDDAEPRAVGLRNAVARADAVRVNVDAVSFASPRFVAFSSRTAPSATPTNIVHKARNARIFLISSNDVSKIAKIRASKIMSQYNKYVAIKCLIFLLQNY